ncbi:MAG: methyl-accepting chemotaxis protein [Pseudomonadota bacterium]
MKLRTQIIAIVAIPIVGIAIVSGLGLRAALDLNSNARAVQTTISHAVPIGAMIHELQVERGMSAGFLSSGGVTFRDELRAQRQATDRTIADFRSVADGIASHHPNEVNVLNAALDRVTAMRDLVSDQQAAIPEMAEVYTDAIRHALTANVVSLGNIQIAAVSRIGIGWISLAEAKEAAGRERATGVVGFDAGRFEPDVLKQYKEFGAVQKTNLEKTHWFLEGTSLDADYESFAEFQAVDALRKVVAEASGETDLAGVTASDWFSVSTAWIDRLRATEVDLGNAAVSMAANKAQAATRDVIIYGAISALALLASVLGGWIVTKGFSRRMRHLGEALGRIAKKDFDVPINTVGEKSEIGDLSRGLDTMRDELRAADVHLRDAFSKSFAYGGSSAAMVIVDPELRINSFNQAAAELFRARETDLQTVWPGFDAASPGFQSVAGLAGSEEEMKRRLSDPSSLPWLTDLDVGELKLEFNATYVETEEGDYAGNVLQLRDVTVERLHTGIVESIERDQCVAELALDGTILRVNAVFAEAIGTLPDAVHGKSLTDLLAADDPLKGNDADLWRKIAGGSADSSRLKLMNADRTVWMRATMTPILDAEGRCFKVSLLGEDITVGVERHAREAAAKAKAEEARNLIVNCLAEGLSNIAEGNLTYRIETAFEAEFDGLRTDFNKTVEQLAAVMSGVLESVERLRASSSELKSASGDLARRTEGQAATLEETAAALDEITATVQTTASESKSADGVVAEARNGAERGSQTVSKAISAMDQIVDSSQQISSIIKVIDDISFQTNLLALNAGVEAARAGEAGRGFAVVASEVRALAQRAAEAAREIGALITTSRAHVDDGVALVGGAGKVLTEIAELVVKASERVVAIRRASEEQAAGLGQINSSVNSMDQATQQNAAMVEEASALSSTLSGDADDLARLVSAFRTDGAREANTTETPIPLAASA